MTWGESAGEERKGGGKSGRGSFRFKKRESRSEVLRIIVHRLLTHYYNLYITYIIRKFICCFGSATLHEGCKITTFGRRTEKQRLRNNEIKHRQKSGWLLILQIVTMPGKIPNIVKFKEIIFPASPAGFLNLKRN